MRNKTIDIAKGLGILLVVFGHNWIVLHEKGELFRVIFSFHMPLFFFLSGVFFKETESLPSLLWSKADSLLKPYFVVLAGLGIVYIFSGKGSLLYFIGLLYSTGATIAWVQLWFLPHLFVVMVFCWFTVKIFTGTFVSPKGLVFLPGLFLLLGTVTIQLFWFKPMQEFGGPTVLFGKRALLPGLPFSIDLLFITSAYLLAGYVMSAYAQSFSFNAAIFVCAASFFFGLHFFFDETIDLHSRIYGNVLISSMQAFLGIYLVISIAALLSSSHRFGSSLAYVGSGSIFILIFHWVFMDATKIFFDAMAPSMPYVGNSFAFLSGVLMPLALLEFVKRKWLLSVLFLPRERKLPS